MRPVRAAVYLFLACAAGLNAAEPLPYYDIRLDSDGLPRSFVSDAITAARAAGKQAIVDAGKAKLNAAVPDFRVDAHEFFGTPHWVISSGGFLTGPSKNPATAPRDVVRAFIAEHADLFEIEAGELDRAALTRDFQTAHNGITHLTFQQRIGGIDLYGCEVLANVARQGGLINVSSTMLPRPAGDFRTAPATLSALDAIRAAAGNVGIAMNSDPTPLAAPAGVAMRQTWKNTPDFRADEPITSELIYFPLTRLDIRPAWSVLIPEHGIGNTYEMMIDATNGQVLRRWNRLHFATTEPASYRIYTSDSPAPMSPGTPTPNGFQAPFVAQTLVTVNPEDISAISQNGWIPDGSNETLGNNCSAHLDLNDDEQPDLPRPAGNPYRVFDFPHDPTQSPTTANNRAAAVVQLFYLTNNYHDKLHALGFNEAAKNFQTNNFGLGGSGNDAVQADCQDGQGFNNANFSTSGGDGTNARMQMYIWNGPNPDRDGSLDANIVYHELSHGLSIRLSNSTVSGTQSGGMGEGWGDFFGLSLTAEAADDPHGTYCTGGYSTFQLSGLVDNYYFGIRRFPYSTDMTKNPTTYADIDNAQVSYPPGVPSSPGVGSFISATASQVHNVGSVWCNMLWEARANMVDASGFAANETMMRLVVDGLKLQPTNPNFLQARDAIIAADVANNAGVNRGRLWRAFAKRGIGPLATSPSGGSSSVGIVESFTLYTFAYPLGRPAQLQPGATTTFQVQISGVVPEIAPVPNTGVLFISVNNGAFTQSPMTEISPGLYDVVLPALNCFDAIRYYVRVSTGNDLITDPSTPPAQTYSASVYQSESAVFSDNFEANLGWTVTNTALATGAWTRVDPIGTTSGGMPVQPENDNSATGTLCYVTQQGLAGGTTSAADVDGGPTVLRSPGINLSAPDAQYTLSYARWIYSNGDDPLIVEISNNDGTSWSPVESVAGTTVASWTVKSWDLNALIAPTAQVRVRFRVSDNPNNSTTEAGVDDVVISQRICSQGVTCVRGDVNADLVVDGRDIGRFAAILVSGSATPVEICAGDLETTADSQVNLDDLDGFVACLLAGGCP